MPRSYDDFPSLPPAVVEKVESATEGYFRVAGSGLALVQRIDDVDTFLRIGEQLEAVIDAVKSDLYFLLGDWFNLWDKSWGPAKTYLMEKRGWSESHYKRITGYAFVARKVPKGKREPQLKWWLWQRLARFEYDDIRFAWIDECRKHKRISRHTLEAAIQGNHFPDEADLVERAATLKHAPKPIRVTVSPDTARLAPAGVSLEEYVNKLIREDAKRRKS